VWLSTASLGHNLPAATSSAAAVFSQVQNQPLSSYNRLLTERAKRGLFSSLAGLASSGLAVGGNKEPDLEDATPAKPKPYDFNEVEMTAIQAMISLRDIIGDLLQRVGINIPSLASLVTRSETGAEKGTSTSALLADSPSALSTFTSKTSNVGVQVLRGLALSLPLLIPMATQIRRMSPDTQVTPTITIPSMPMIPDLYYYNQAMHRRRGKRSLNYGQVGKRAPARVKSSLHDAAVEHMLSSRPILDYLRKMGTKYGTQ